MKKLKDLQKKFNLTKTTGHNKSVNFLILNQNVTIFDPTYEKIKEFIFYKKE